MADKQDDIRSWVDLDQEVSSWFWEVVQHGRQNRDTLTHMMQEFSREDLIRFQTELEQTASYFHCSPFCPDHLASATFVDEAAQWVVSQGLSFVLQVWADPALFSGILNTWSGEEIGSSYESVAVNVYFEHFGEEMPPLQHRF